MLTVAAPDATELRSNAIFEALMWAMSRPGDIRTMPSADLNGIVETLIDLECSAYAETPALREAIVGSGAMLVDDIAAADFAFLDTLTGVENKLGRINLGSAVYPDDGATLVVLAAHERGTRVRLTGPGILGSKDVTVDIAPKFWAWRAEASLYPEGFDLVVVDDADLLAIPRSTQVEVL